MREKIRTAALAAAGIAALAGGTFAATDAAVAKKHGRHAGNGGGAPRQAPAALTGDAKTQAEAAALAAVPGGTVDRSFAAKADNPDGAAYVVRVEKADGSHVDVLEDASFAVLETVEARPCAGGRGPRGRGGAPAPLTGDTKTQAEAAALAAVPGGEVERSHAARPDNPDGAVYAVDVEKSDDSYVVVLEDAAFKVIKVLDRPPHGPGGERGDRDGSRR